jgi:transcriptional regulator with XRE-family HTH domain
MSKPVSWKVIIIYKNKAATGRNNISGINIAKIRKSLVPRVSQRALAARLQLEGLDLDKNAIQRIESGQRFVTDIELKAFAQVLQTKVEYLLEESSN